MECEHDYKLIKNVERETFKQLNTASMTYETLTEPGYMIFHCSKCLDIQKKVIR